MSRAGEAAEWSYKHVKQNLKTIVFALKIQVQRKPAALKHKIEFLLWNIKVFLHSGVQVFMYFGYYPPSLDNYLSPLNQDIYFNFFTNALRTSKNAYIFYQTSALLSFKCKSFFI